MFFFNIISSIILHLCIKKYKKNVSVKFLILRREIVLVTFERRRRIDFRIDKHSRYISHKSTLRYSVNPFLRPHKTIGKYLASKQRTKSF